MHQDRWQPGFLPQDLAGGGVEQTDLASLVNHREQIEAGRSLAEVYQWFQSHHHEFCAVTDADRLAGICSRARLGFLMAHRYGFAIYSKQRGDQHVLERPLILQRGMPVRHALELALSRADQEFHDDIALVDRAGKYLGMISMPAFVRLQSALVEERFRLQELLYERLVLASREAGKAEIATGVLHNVGNVLNSVNISAGLLMDSARRSKISSFEQATALLADRKDDLAQFLTSDPRGKMLPEFLAKLALRLRAERDEEADELESLVKHVDHIKQIVNMQQSYARAMGIRESVDVAAIVEDALKMNNDSFARGHVAVGCAFHPTRHVIVDRHKVLLVLTNLLRNARQAVESAQEMNRRIEIRIVETSGAVAIVVRDYGVGIAPENISRIFNHGFTTKPGGHGFGLHSSALVAREMGGSLRAQSDGLDQGATFTLELPIQPAETDTETSHANGSPLDALAAPEPSCAR